MTAIEFSTMFHFRFHINDKWTKCCGGLSNHSSCLKFVVILLLASIKHPTSLILWNLISLDLLLFSVFTERFISSFLWQLSCCCLMFELKTTISKECWFMQYSTSVSWTLLFMMSCSSCEWSFSLVVFHKCWYQFANTQDTLADVHTISLTY